MHSHYNRITNRPNPNTIAGAFSFDPSTVRRMGSGRRRRASLSVSRKEDAAEVCERHRLDLENLTLTSRPFRTLQLFICAIIFYLKRSLSYVFGKFGWLVAISILLSAFGLLLLLGDVLHEEHLQGSLNYFRFGLWWVALGIASSIGLGSGLHTFVLYLGPHIALFTIKAMQCGRTDLKVAPYDTIQLKGGPSWLEKDCSSFGPPLFASFPDSLVRVPFSSILPQVQLEAVLWGVGTALGELPPYFISRAARMSGSKSNALEEFNNTSSEKHGFVSSLLNQLKRWLFSRSQHLNFFVILVLASIPNPLFDLAGIMCGQFGIPFWKFFLATLTGKAIIKTHLQSIFVILLCNNQLLQLAENELIWVFSHIPGFSSILPNLVTKLHKIKEAYVSAQVSNPSQIKVKQWKLSFNLIWNAILWLMLVNFFCKIVTATAQAHLKKQQDAEFESTNKQSPPRNSQRKSTRVASSR